MMFRVVAQIMLLVIAVRIPSNICLVGRIKVILCNKEGNTDTG
jgi:hypothetical protein